MTRDKRIVYATSATTFVALLVLSLIPYAHSRIIAALLLAAATAITLIFIKKRNLLSYNKQQVFWLLLVMAATFVMLYFLTGLHFGFATRSWARFTWINIWQALLPIASIVVCSELVRGVLLAQNAKAADVFAYLIGVWSEVLVVSGFGTITGFNRFMDVIGLTLFPAVISNLLYQYLSRRYGAAPNISYRLITTLYAYAIPFSSLIPDSLLAFAKMLLPLLVYWFIDALYEKKTQYAAKRKSRWGWIGWGALATALVGVVMLTSGQFYFGTLVIGSESMTGEYNKGDLVVYERFEDQTLKAGDVLVFLKGNTRLVHRVVALENVNGQIRYYTKGDANEDLDAGFITEEAVIGVADVKIPYLGYPTIWIRSLFA